MGNKVIGLIGVVAVVALVLGVVGFRSTNTTIKEFVGASAGPEHTERQFFAGGSTEGRNCFSTTTTGTLTTFSMSNNSCINIAAAGAGQGTVSLTLPASTTLGAIIPKAGDCANWFIDNSNVAAATTTTIVAGTGVDLVGLDATGAGTGADVIDGGEYGRLTLCRQLDTDVVGYVTEWINAD